MPRTEKKNEQMRDITRWKIRDAALKQFSKKGLSAARIQDIAAEAHISQGLIYRHYNSKDEIFADLIEDALNKLNEAAHAVFKQNVSAREKITMTLDRIFETIKSSDNFRQTCRFISHAMNSECIPEHAVDILNEKREIPYRIFSQIMHQGQQEGSLIDGDPDKMAVLFWSTVNGLAIYHATRTGQVNLPDPKHIERMFFRDLQEGRP